MDDDLEGLGDAGGEFAAVLDVGEGEFGDEAGGEAGERMRAAATASWMARLMPMPPTGDMAWAASPMQRRPGRCQRVRRLT